MTMVQEFIFQQPKHVVPDLLDDLYVKAQEALMHKVDEKRKELGYKTCLYSSPEFETKVMPDGRIIITISTKIVGVTR